MTRYLEYAGGDMGLNWRYMDTGNSSEYCLE